MPQALNVHVFGTQVGSPPVLPLNPVLLNTTENPLYTCCCGNPRGLLCWLRGAGSENSDNTLWSDIRGKRFVNSSTSGEDLQQEERILEWRLMSSSYLLLSSKSFSTITIPQDSSVVKIVNFQHREDLQVNGGVWCHNVHITFTERVHDSSHSPVNQMGCYGKHLTKKKKQHKPDLTSTTVSDWGKRARKNECWYEQLTEQIRLTDDHENNKVINGWSWIGTADLARINQEVADAV